MIKSSPKTIRDYFQATAVPSRRNSAIAPQTRPFESVLQGLLESKEASPPPASTGLTVRDYLNQRLGGRPARAVVSRPDDPVPSAVSGLPPDKLCATGAMQTPTPANPVAAPPAIPAPTHKEAVSMAIQRAAEKYNVPADLVRSVIRCESNFDARAVSRAGAQGLMQLMPATAADLGVSDSFDIDQNVDGGTRYLRQMLDRFEGDIELALAAYNAGPGTVSRYGGVPPYRETQAYVKKVLHLANLPETVKIA
jgi:hypothetical protein